MGVYKPQEGFQNARAMLQDLVSADTWPHACVEERKNKTTYGQQNHSPYQSRGRGNLGSRHHMTHPPVRLLAEASTKCPDRGCLHFPALISLPLPCLRLCLPVQITLGDACLS